PLTSPTCTLHTSPPPLPTRRSADLLASTATTRRNWSARGRAKRPAPENKSSAAASPASRASSRTFSTIELRSREFAWKKVEGERSEEHTTELHSRVDVGCRRLLERK